MATYQFVVTTEEGPGTVYSDEVEQIAEAMDAKITGFNQNTRQREDLQGHPTLEGYVGPFWGGETEFGEPIIRYEDNAAYAALSM
jgi:hypothetical protein